MDRPIVLSATIAAALHAGLLLGIRGPSSATCLPPEKLSATVSKIFEIVISDEPPPAPAENLAEKAPSGPRPIISPEPLPFDTHAEFEIPTPRVVPMKPTDEITKIPLSGQGPSDGKITPGDGDGGSIINAKLLDHTPHTRSQVAPVYPHEARARGETGEVVVEFVVDESGAVRSPRVVRSTNRVFEEPTLRAVSRWRFEPGRRDGAVVPFRMMIPVRFNLDSI